MTDTITVTGYFGKDKQVTREEYISTWKEHASQFHRLRPSAKWEDLEMVEATVLKWAEDEFDRLLNES